PPAAAPWVARKPFEPESLFHVVTGASSRFLLDPRGRFCYRTVDGPMGARLVDSSSTRVLLPELDRRYPAIMRCEGVWLEHVGGAPGRGAARDRGWARAGAAGSPARRGGFVEAAAPDDRGRIVAIARGGRADRRAARRRVRPRVHDDAPVRAPALRRPRLRLG